MTKLEHAIIQAVADRHDIPEDKAARWVDDALENGSMSTYFPLVASSAMEVTRPLWNSILTLARAIGPMFADAPEEQDDDWS